MQGRQQGQRVELTENAAKEGEEKQSNNKKSQGYSHEHYAKAQFWEKRYAQNNVNFDWYAEYSELRDSLQKQYKVKKSDRILMIGCGNSKLSEQMYDAGYKDIVNMDISVSVIEQMRKCAPQMQWQVGDALNLPYHDRQFDCALDKGTLDALISGGNLQTCERMLAEAMRVTKKQFILITYGSPQGRRRIFSKGLPFHLYSYYQCAAYLNETSTLINLMRSNQPDAGLKDIIKNKVAMKKTLFQYNLLKMLRRNKVPIKTYIVWNKKQHKLEISEKKEKNKKDNFKQGKQQKSNQKQQKQYQIIQKDSEQRSNNYKVTTSCPSKQSFVYVYSIRRKDAIGVNLFNASMVQHLRTEHKVQIKGQKEGILCFRINQQLFQKCLQIISFIKSQNMQYPTIELHSKTSPTINYDIECGYKNELFLLKRTKIKVSVKEQNQNLYQSMKAVQSQMHKTMLFLKNEFQMYPHPKTYNLFYEIKSRFPNFTVNKLLQKYYFPSWEMDSQGVFIYLPPHLDQYLVIDALVGLFQRETFRGNVDIVEGGFISEYSQEVIQFLNDTLLRYSEGEVFEPSFNAPRGGKHQIVINLKQTYFSEIIYHILRGIQ